MVAILCRMNVFNLCSGWQQKFPEDTGPCNQMERLAHITFKYWLNALPDPPKLVRLALRDRAVADNYNDRFATLSMDFTCSGVFT
ncbi:hypothetical protein BL240_11450 [Pseudomonas putida]|uniref:Uncharacterized protein n=1 Tax=Pseudomonas putida TaxID=303 RepID=A0A1L5PPG4_PSEPU|nr:hypothetical protein BL240_11450 [Pseudomonas putida]